MSVTYHPLTPSQQLGYDKFVQFYLDPHQTVMVLRGYSGTGKSTLIKTLLRDLPKLADMARTIAPDWREHEPVLTATTNQAAEALHISVDRVLPAKTVHSHLQLKLHTPDYRNPKVKTLIVNGDGVEGQLIFIDEASYIDKKLLKLILQQTRNCKIVFVGDPAQLKSVDDEVEEGSMPAFEMNACSIELTDLIRFDPGPMTDNVNNMRRAVLEQKWTKFALEAGKIERLERKDFMKKALHMFENPDVFGNVKMLAYSNDRVNQFNEALAKRVFGTNHPFVGQKMMVNAQAMNNASSCFTNEEVQIATVEEDEEYGKPGWMIQFVGKGGYYFMPRKRGMQDEAHRAALMKDDYQAMKIIADTWIDLRPTFSCTVNKSQGSTYDYGFIDLDDICRYTRTLDQLARLLYVAISRFRKGVFFTGDLRRS